MRAGIDLDGVCYQWSKTAAFLLNHYWHLSLGESNSWNYLQENVSPEAWKWLWTDGVEKHGLFRHGNVYKGTFEALQTLAKNYELVLITSRPANAMADTYDWIGYHRIPAREVHIIGITTPKSTIQPLCDFYVDDKTENIQDLETTERPAYLMDRPWNQPKGVDTVQRRVYSWAGLLKEVL